MTNHEAHVLAARLSIKVEPSEFGCSVLWPVKKGLRCLTVLNRVEGTSTEESTLRAITRAARAIEDEGRKAGGAYAGLR